MILRRPQLNLDLPYGEIESLCGRFGVAELLIFGSALNENGERDHNAFRADSDVDFLVVFKNGDDDGPWMSRLTAFESELSRLLERKVDVVPRAGVEQSENYIRRRHILDSARPIYVAR